MLSGRRQAIDSAHVKANASMDSLKEKEIIEDGEHYLKELQHDEYGKPVEQHDNVMKDDRDSDTITKSRSKSTEEHHQWKAEEYKGQPKGKSLTKTNDDDHNARPKFVSNHTHYSTTDRDARVSVKPGKPRQLNYSMQTAVDMSSHLITNVEAHLADRRDSECLEQVLKNTIRNLAAYDLVVEEIAADTGYSSTKALKACIDHNITATTFPTSDNTNQQEKVLFLMKQTTVIPARPKVFACRIKKPTRIKKAIIKSSTAPRPKIAAGVLCAQAALEEEPITKR